MVPKGFVIVDGLDECEHVERKEVIDILMNIVGQCNAMDPGKLRVLLVSQYHPEIYRVLHSSTATSLRPGIFKITDTHNRSDIETYVTSWVERIAQKFPPVSKAMREYLQSITVHNAKGMF